MQIDTITQNLIKKDEIWFTPTRSEISYPEEGNQICFDVEDNSFWFKHRNNCIVKLIQNFPPPNGLQAIFDIGGGNGFVSHGVQSAGYEAFLVEPGIQGALNAVTRGVENVICATSQDVEFENNSLPAIGTFDVIEHIEDDYAFVQHLYDKLMPSGRFYLTVPAFNLIWSDEDVLAGHFRRYTLKTISSVVQKAGFEINYASYFFRFLPLPIFLLRSLPFRLGKGKDQLDAQQTNKQHSGGGGISQKILDYLLHSEVENVMHRKRMKFGSSCLLCCTKPQSS